MDADYAAKGLMGRLAERKADLERRIAAERARPVPDQGLIRRLTRELLLARDRLAALGGCAMPRWAREAPAAE
ncbi:DUF465 domain-containing protein [Falsiroseomonas oryziterrae]|uniref:DUF465 domain-containing protein n=1 Tax=Falsiroseomonas oryziterrae TaxID=2911368 RepID=UPI001F39FE0C|nr:DUF465 domain-containing protein [Roseomonas sp. NPKOSM-4]